MASTIPTLNLKPSGKMPIVGLGGAVIENPEDEAIVEKTIELGLENGYRHIDTAFIYGTEKPIGNVIKRWIEAGKIKREDLFITTKLPPYGIYPDKVEYFLKKSLANLQLDYVDLYLIHHPIGSKFEEGVEEKHFVDLDVNPNTDHIGTWKKMEEQVDAGRAKAIGLSNFNIKQTKRILDKSRIPPANNQVRLHLHHQQKKLVDFLRKNGISVVAYSPLGRPQAAQPGQKQFGSPVENILDEPIVKEFAKKYSKTPGQILLKHIVQKGIAVVPKSTSSQRQKENLDIFDFTISPVDVKKLDALDRQGTPKETTWLDSDKYRNHPEYPEGI